MIKETPLFGKVDVQVFAPYSIEHSEEVIYSQGFESSTDGWTPDAYSTVSTNSTYKRTGSQALKVLSSSDNYSNVYRTITGLTIGVEYTISGYANGGGSGPVPIVIGVTGVGVGTGPGSAPGAFELRSYTFTATATSHEVYLKHSFGTAWWTSGDAVWWDDLTITQSAWTDSGESWSSVIPDATGVTIHRGGIRDGLAIRTDVGLCTFTLHNAEDPMDGGSLKPGQAVQVLAEDDAPIFTGKIANLNSVYPINKDTGESRAKVEVTVADAVQIHTTTPRYGVTIPDPYFETFEERIDRLDGSARAELDVPEIGAPREVYAF